MAGGDFEILKTHIINGLQARLSLDAGLGVDYVSSPVEYAEIVEKIIHVSTHVSAPAAPRDLSRSEPGRGTPDIPVARPVSGKVLPKTNPAPERSPPGHLSLVPLVPSKPNPEKERELAAMQSESVGCMLCELCSRRNSVVWGEGCLDASVMFIGEGPGRDEDIEGRPFVGRSGRLLTDIIEKGMKTPRSAVYIANVVKCRPPGNRDPKPDEVAACAVYLRRQIEVIRPRAIVAVGMVAGRALLGLPPGTGGLRRKWHEYAGIPMRVIYHPSYLLRQRQGDNHRTDADVETWKDIQEVMSRLQGPAPE